MIRTQKREKFTVADDRCAVTYGPALDREDAYVLTVLTNDEKRVELVFPEYAMYRLWTEVRNVPRPAPEKPMERDRLVQQVLQYANGAGEEQLRECLRVLRGGQ